MEQASARVAGAVAPPPLVFLGGFILGVVINFFSPVPIWRGIWIELVGVIPLGLGVWLLASANTAFKHHGTPPEPWKPSVELVQDGPYGLTRNPIYLSFALIYLGMSFFLNSILALVILVPTLALVDRGQIQREERYLEEKFGEEYDRYRNRVRRWI